MQKINLAVEIARLLIESRLERLQMIKAAAESLTRPAAAPEKSTDQNKELTR